MLFRNSLRLFRLFGVDVFLNWTWVFAPIIMVGLHREAPILFTIALCLVLFAIVLLHEFGHALACKSVGGRADRIVLWPLGGIAFVQPPPRPGPVLWSLAAGPLVNVLLIPVTLVPLVIWYYTAGHLTAGHFGEEHGWGLLFARIAEINLGLLIFNLFPVYPLDGGQILQALLWFVIGRPMSLIIAASIGLAGGAGLVLLGLWASSPWLAVLAIFIGLQSLAALRQGLALHRIAATPRYHGPQCPNCREAPPIGIFWQCTCGQPFDTFAHRGICPRCGQLFSTVMCPHCFTTSPAMAWFAHLPAAVTIPPVVVNEPQPAPRPAL